VMQQAVERQVEGPGPGQQQPLQPQDMPRPEGAERAHGAQLGPRAADKAGDRDPRAERSDRERPTRSQDRAEEDEEDN
jgi:hypothetical protein